MEEKMKSFKLYEHQEEVSISLQKMIKDNNIAILSLPERSGKTLIAIDSISKIGFKSPLWVTKKNAIPSIKEDLKMYGVDNFTVVNYEMLHKVISNHDIIICDEFHTISAFPKPSVRAKQLQKFRGSVFIYISATPASESASQWFMPLSLSSYHDFGYYKNFYDWARSYVNVTKKRVGSFFVNDYTNAINELVMNKVNPFIISVFPNS